MSTPEAGRRLKLLAYLWWVKVPVAVHSVSAGASAAILDGIYLNAWPRVAALAPPASLLAGLMIGWGHLGFQTVFSESMALMVLAAIIGVCGGGLGAWFVAGFVLGDFVLATMPRYAGGPWDGLLKVRLPRLIEYGLLWLLVVQIPVTAMALVRSLNTVMPANRQVRTYGAMAGLGLVTMVLVHFWTQAVPILIRPVFTWPGGYPPVSAMAPLQVQGMILVLCAALAATGRMYFQIRAVFDEQGAVYLAEVKEQLLLANPGTPLGERLSVWARPLGHAVWLTLFLSGMYHSWLDATLLGLLIAAIQAAQAGLIRVPLGGWKEWVLRVPLLLRLAGVLLILQYVAGRVLQQQMFRTGTFRPILMLTGMALVLFYLVNPSPAAAGQRGERGLA